MYAKPFIHKPVLSICNSIMVVYDDILVLLCLFDLLLNFHDKHLRSCGDGWLLTHTIPGQAFRSRVFGARSFASN